MNELLKQTVSLSLLAKCIAAVVGIPVIHLSFRVLERILPKRLGRADSCYKVRKFIPFVGYLSILVFLVFLFEDRLGRLSFGIGLAGAGIAVGLQDIIASIAGAFSIAFSKLYALGDRRYLEALPVSLASQTDSVTSLRLTYGHHHSIAFHYVARFLGIFFCHRDISSTHGAVVLRRRFL
jgi:hypothetical protein